MFAARGSGKLAPLFEVSLEGAVKEKEVCRNLLGLTFVTVMILVTGNEGCSCVC